MSFEESVDGWMDGLTDGLMDDQQISITIAHLEHLLLR